MIKQIITLIFIFHSVMLAAQARVGVRNQIKGEIVEKTLGADSIYFSFGSINSKYYINAVKPSKLTANQYIVNNSLNYPQMYRISFLTDKHIRPWREGNYFIDPSTTTIRTNFKYGNCSETNGVTGQEYQSRFIPFVTKGVIYDCRSDYLFDLFNDSNSKADSILLNYIKTFPDSYVALWKLIERFSSYGQSLVRQQALAGFSTKMKQGVLWNKLDRDFKETKIKEGEVFPDVALKTVNIEPTKLVLPKAKFVLIDFWFARCKPCLDTIPIMKKLYDDYHKKGFEIVSISVDETINIPIWQKRIKEHGLVWTQYLEENNFRSNELGVKLFPTFLLLDDKGVVINKDFDLHELDNFLSKNL